MCLENTIIIIKIIIDVFNLFNKILIFFNILLKIKNDKMYKANVELLAQLCFTLIIYKLRSQIRVLNYWHNLSNDKMYKANVELLANLCFILVIKIIYKEYNFFFNFFIYLILIY